MTDIKIMKCDTCGKVAESDNHYKEGWIEFDGELSRGFGVYDKTRGCFKSQWINARGNTKHFCSWGCLENYNDNRVKGEKQ